MNNYFYSERHEFEYENSLSKTIKKLIKTSQNAKQKEKFENLLLLAEKLNVSSEDYELKRSEILCELYFI